MYHVCSNQGSNAIKTNGLACRKPKLKWDAQFRERNSVVSPG